MRKVTFVPGAVVSPAAITIPADAPDIDAVVSAQIIRLPAGITVAVNPHVLAGGGGAASVALAAGLFTDTGAGGNVAHVVAANVGADPVVAAVPTRLTTRTISLNVNTALGDLLTLNYREVGERVLVS